MNCEPDRRRLRPGPGHAVAAMRGEQDPTRFADRPVLAFAFDTQARRAFDQQHPFVGVLVIPLAFRGRLTGRRDPLDAHTWSIDQGREGLLGENARRQLAQDISVFTMARRNSLVWLVAGPRCRKTMTISDQ